MIDYYVDIKGDLIQVTCHVTVPSEDTRPSLTYSHLCEEDGEDGV